MSTEEEFPKFLEKLQDDIKKELDAAENITRKPRDKLNKALYRAFSLECLDKYEDFNERCFQALYIMNAQLKNQMLCEAEQSLNTKQLIKVTPEPNSRVNNKIEEINANIREKWASKSADHKEPQEIDGRVKIAPTFSDSSKCLPPSQEIFEMIDEIKVLHGKVASDDTIWEVYIRGKKVIVPAKKLTTQKAFQEAYLNVFSYPAPSVSKSSIWLELVKNLHDYKAIHISAPEESESVLVSRAVFEIICEMPITTDDVESVAAGQALHDFSGSYWITVKRVHEIIESLRCGFGSSTISNNLTQLGMKYPGTPTHRLGDIKPRCWQIKPEAVENTRNGV